MSHALALGRLTAHLADQRRLTVNCNPGLPQILAGADGQCYSKYGLGMPLLAAVAYKAGKLLTPLLAPRADAIAIGHFAVSYLNVLLTAATELGPGQWIPSILEHAGVSGILVLVWITGLMAVGRMFAGPFVHKLSPIGMLVASAHSSHSYRQGTNLYVTFGVKPENFADAEVAYVGAWTAVMEATLASGGSISHHHGIGRMRVPWIERELGTSYPVLRALKRALDPDGLMNPGVLLLG